MEAAELQSNPLLRDSIADTIRGQIRDGKLLVGQRLPSERQLSETYGVSRPTVRRALAVLTEEGLLESRAGAGTFVRGGRGVEKEPARLRSSTLALIIPDISNPFFSDLAKIIESSARKIGYRILLANTGYDMLQESERVEQFLEDGVDGFLVAPAPVNWNPEPYYALRRAGKAFVYVTHYPGDIYADYVVADNYGGVFQSIEHLIKLGHTRIAYVTGSPYYPVNIRLQGFRGAQMAHNLPISDKLIVYSDKLNEEGGRETARKLLELPQPPTAIFANNDITAIGVYQELIAQGVRIPEDISLVGFDNIPASAHLAVPLTTVEQPATMMGERAVELISERIRQPGTIRYSGIVAPTTLIIRRSSGTVKNGV